MGLLGPVTYDTLCMAFAFLLTERHMGWDVLNAILSENHRRTPFLHSEHSADETHRFSNYSSPYCWTSVRLSQLSITYNIIIVAIITFHLPAARL